MFEFSEFFSLYGPYLLIALLGVGIGILLALVWLNNKHRQVLMQHVEQTQQVREELANTKGQLGQLQQGSQEKDALLRAARQQLGHEFESLANRIFERKQQQFEEQSHKTLSHTLDPLKSQITEFKRQVADAYEKENAERNKLVGKIDALQEQTQKIGEDAVNLALALKGDNKSQGNWGEVILERLLEESGLQKGREYHTQVALVDNEGQRRNPDVIIHLPEDKQLVIDSKVSLAHYERYVNADDAKEQEQALKLHIDSVRQHIKGLSRKNYEELQGIQTLDFVFIFMPIEAAFMLALQHDPSLFKEAYDRQIVLVSPTTLLATLRTVENLWRYHKQHKNAEEIARQAGGLHDQFILVAESLDDIGNQLDKTRQAYEKTKSRLVDGRGNLVKRIHNLKTLGAKTKKQLPESLRKKAEDNSDSLLQELPETTEMAESDKE